MKIALGQVNPLVGDLEGNVRRCRAAWLQARSAGAELLVLPELAMPGCPPRDILFDASFVQAMQAAALDLARQTQDGPPLLIGTVLPAGPARAGHPNLYNAAALLIGGEVRLAAAKRLLRSQDVFHEPRWFAPGPALPPLEVAGARLGVLFDADLEDEGRELHPAAELAAAGAQLLVCLAASPYSQAVYTRRLQAAARAPLPLLYANLAGATDELIFDGRSFACLRSGELLARAQAFREQVLTIDCSPFLPWLCQDKNGEHIKMAAPDAQDGLAELFAALVLGVADFFAKNRIERAFLGLSGGVDSALAAVIAARALGPQRVTAVAMPSRYSDPRSTACARELAAALGIGFEVVELEPLHLAAEAALGDLLAQGSAAENLQARLRALILLGYVNRYGGLLLNTSNKTELSLGYGTVGGDLSGTLCPLGDLTKPDIYRLAHWVNTERPVIPEFILTRPPSAELRPEQVDPFDYPALSPQLEQLVQENRSNEALRRAENKRWQLGVVLRVTDKAFGSGRLIPITRR